LLQEWGVPNKTTALKEWAAQDQKHKVRFPDEACSQQIKTNKIAHKYPVCYTGSFLMQKMQAEK
jgi:hypothetical protein